MPVVEKLMKSLVDRYGEAEGKRVYYAMEAEGKGPFGPGGKYHQLHRDFAERNGVVSQSVKKPRSSKPRKRGSRKR